MVTFDPKERVRRQGHLTIVNRWAETYNLTLQPSKLDKVKNLTIFLTFDPEERVGRRGHYENF